MAHRYTRQEEIKYHSDRYGRNITVTAGYVSDGASGAKDVDGISWWVHDWICGNWLNEGPKPIGGQWDDGTPITNWQASMIICDILREESRHDNWWEFKLIRSYSWFLPTWIFGGGKCRENGFWPWS